MPIDPRIAMGLQVPDIAGSIRQGMDWHDKRQDKKRLADLIPQAMGRGGMGEGGAVSQDDAIAQLYSIDPRIAARMDERQREFARELTGDLSNAVRWANTPERWQQVQQHYGGKGVDLSPYSFEDRERGLMALGQLDGYLKDPPKPDIRATEPGGGLYAVNPDGSVRVLVQPNPGDQPMGAPAQGKEITATGPGGQKLRLNPQTNQWEPMGGPTQPASGGFPY